jgi:hypothetical protein
MNVAEESGSKEPVTQAVGAPSAERHRILIIGGGTAGIKDKAHVSFCSAGKAIFGVKPFADPSIPFINTLKERYDMWLLKKYGLPRLYWHLMLRGLA